MDNQLIFLDTETRSRTPITAGIHQYFNDPDACVLILAYALGDGPVRFAEPHEAEALCRGRTVVANNAVFDLMALGLPLDTPHIDTMSQALAHNLPGGLDAMANVLLPGRGKTPGANRLIRLFSIPDAKTGAFAKPEDHPEDWAAFRQYCLEDVELLRDVYRVLPQINYPRREEDRKIYAINNRINDRGIRIDRALSIKALALAEDVRASANDRLAALTSGRITSVGQIEKIAKLTGCPSLSSEAVAEALEFNTEPVRGAILELRQEAGQSSATKFVRILEAASDFDDRVRGQFIFRGSDRCGRFSGRGIQIHNLPRGKVKKEALEYDTSCLLHDAQDFIESDPMALAVSLVRAVFVPSPGGILIDSDWSAIEARLLAWAVGEQWVLDAFANGIDVYKATYAEMAGGTLATVDGIGRTVGKLSTLLLGYGGGAGAIIRGARTAGVSMGSLVPAKLDPEMLEAVRTKAWLQHLRGGVPDRWIAAAEQIKKTWRAIRPATVAAWSECEDALAGRQSEVMRCKFRHARNVMSMELPSGRRILYWGLQREEDGFSVMQTTGAGMVRLPINGRRICQNAIQAMAADVLGTALIRLDALGAPVVCHVHDEILLDAPLAEADRWAETLRAVMLESPDWLPAGLLETETKRLARFAK